MLSARNITLTLGHNTVLHDTCFDAAPGEVTAICGPNGSGKTSLLRCLSGDLPHGGRVTLNGEDISTLEPWQLAARRGVLPQASQLAFPFTTLELVEIGLSHARAPAEGAALRALARTGLAHHAERPVNTLSGGQQQRAHLARVLAQVGSPVGPDSPRWLLLDEPVSALDIAHQLQVMQIARDFADAGGGVVAVMHDLNLTAMFADSVTLMAGGRPLASGTTADVMTSDTLGKAYGCTLRVGSAPPPGTPFVLPQTATA
ncbi:hemin import ATP-binding protein HmuV [Salipiger pallidus]|uniref:Hemin import ATP-binding protein HmuV n=1 Tax=Salipiger pallidus TaxID=1775170 RepID=A0A8J3EE64_9RHOB|nr:heme ABC transporter ATP-binding protein [Salipiger pallidus]GGG62416.1 hemin import ATP-binding protein HmuV [Salipiger pallidus]